MKIAPVLAVVALGAAASVAQAEVSSTITLTSDYDFRGLTQTARDPALQASLDWANDSGMYVGAWASNVDFGKGTDADVEVDLYAGFRGSFNDDLSFDVGAIQYAYQPNGDKVDFAEAYGSLTYKAVTAKYSYAWDYGNTGSAASYFELNSAVPLPNDFSLTLHGGYSSGEYWTENYLDYSIGVAKSVGNFAVSLKWVDGSDLQSAQKAPADVFTSDAKLVFSVATTLPWGK
ncbi:MAG: hypothetical protein EB021_04740 [Gammaproteobacteria bacterium]|jgi:uncharacterized protein (TIGR02001 family)|nr:hypothetical protein [Gammaproteobacteria bacterium]NDA42720.1 hypothetical protein [Gammaproteobacteria bacterium]NDB17344.1 hypothetical protein [Gammaproteobacteria bacterium]NDB24738.1 hypothetical protein [Gammaproteobacteria bacterium]NDE87528.1 hypothetical protein [Gammaproteobacteria bacterium]